MTPTYSTRRALALATLALLLPLTPASADVVGHALPAAEDAATHTWGLVPKPVEGQEDRVSFRVEAEPGQAVQDVVTVQNFSDEEVTFALTASDGIVTPEGVFDILPSDAEAKDVGTWVDLPEEVTVPAQGTTDVPFTLTVPQDALPGDHPGGITASVLTTSADDAGNQVALDARVGVRLHLRVAGELTPSVEVQDVRADYTTNWNPFAPGELTLDYTVANTGNVRVGATQDVDVEGPLGVPAAGAADAAAQQREILPRQSSSQQVVVRAWPLVHLTGEITSAQNVVGEDQVDAALEDARANAGVWAVPWPQLIVLAALAALVLLWRRRAVGQRRRLEAAVARARAEGRAEAGAGSTAAPAVGGTLPEEPTHRN